MPLKPPELFCPAGTTLWARATETDQYFCALVQAPNLEQFVKLVTSLQGLSPESKEIAGAMLQKNPAMRPHYTQALSLLTPEWLNAGEFQGPTGVSHEQHTAEPVFEVLLTTHPNVTLINKMPSMKTRYHGMRFYIGY